MTLATPTPVEMLPVYTDAPTPAGLVVLRLLLAGRRLVTGVDGCGRVVAAQGGVTVPLAVLARLATAGLVAERATGPRASEYALTPAGRRAAA